MKPESTDASPTLNLVRQQLMLAQVRIMELEDVRDEMIPQLTEATKLLRDAQLLADQKIDEAAHNRQVHTSLQSEFQHLRHIQHLTNEALVANREELAGHKERLAAVTAELDQLEQLRRTLAENLSRVSGSLDQTTSTLADKEQHIIQLDTEIRRMKNSRSWRWTQVLRTVERWFKKRPAP